MLIAIAGPYSADSADKRQRNLDALNQAAVEVLRLGHTPVIGVNAALPISQQFEPEDQYETIMSISLALVDKCDGILVLGESPGVIRELRLIESKNLPVYRHLNEIPRA